MVSASHGLLHCQCATVGSYGSRSAEVSKNATYGIKPIGPARDSTQLEPVARAARKGRNRRSTLGVLASPLVSNRLRSAFPSEAATSWGRSSIREKIYGSVLYAMLSRCVLRVRRRTSYAIAQ
jgi:hypothetical protein